MKYELPIGPMFQNESSCKTFLIKISFICMEINLYAELIFIRMASYDDSFSHRREGQSEMAYWPIQKTSGGTLFSTRVSPGIYFSNFACRLLSVRV